MAVSDVHVEKVVEPYGWLSSLDISWYDSGEMNLTVVLKHSGVPCQDEWDYKHAYLETAEKMVAALRAAGYAMLHASSIEFEGEYVFKIGEDDPAYADRGAVVRVAVR